MFLNDYDIIFQNIWNDLLCNIYYDQYHKKKTFVYKKQSFVHNFT